MRSERTTPATGTVHHYTNNINSNPGRKPFGAGKGIVEGFQPCDRLGDHVAPRDEIVVALDARPA